MVSEQNKVDIRMQCIVPQCTALLSGQSGVGYPPVGREVVVRHCAVVRAPTCISLPNSRVGAGLVMGNGLMALLLSLQSSAAKQTV